MEVMKLESYRRTTPRRASLCSTGCNRIQPLVPEEQTKMSMQPWEVQYEQGRDIDRLRKENEQMRDAIDGLNKEAVASITGLGSENERLRAALKDIAYFSEPFLASTAYVMRDKARAAFEQKAPDGA